MIEAETWRVIQGYEGVYEASDMGRIRRVDGKVYDRGLKAYKSIKGRVLKPKIKNNGYARVCLCAGGMCEEKYVHRIIAECFHGSDPGFLDVDHINGERTDNRASNLRWSNRSANIRNSSRYHNSSSEYYGVCWDKHAQKWKSNIAYKGKVIHLGNFVSEFEAAKAYDDFCKSKNLDRELNIKGA